MKQIELTKGRFAIVDDADYEALSKFDWHTKKKLHLFYAARNGGTSPNQFPILMHRVITQATDDLEVYHKDGNGLNNVRSNLRLCTHQQNLFNQKKKIGTKSKYKGVTWCKRNNKWLAQIMMNKKNKFLGYFAMERVAALVYDDKAKELFGEYARTNF